MISLDELLRTVEPAALRSETTQRHLARLLAAQAASTHTSADHVVQAYPAAEDRPVPAGSMGGVDPTSRGRGRRSLIMAVLAAAAVVAVVAVSWSSLARPVVQVPAGTQTQSASATGAKATPVRTSTVAISTSKADLEVDALTTDAAVTALAADLGIDRARATEVVKRLAELAAAGDGLTPTSHEFVQIAGGLGITPQRLIQAINSIKAEPASGKGTASTAAVGVGGLSTDLLTGDAAIATLATQLGVDADRAATAAHELAKLAQAGGGLDPTSAQFAAVAQALDVTPERLAAVIDLIKQQH